MVEVLLDQGANPNITGGEFGTPLQAAACSGYEEICSSLLGHGADANLQAREFGSVLRAVPGSQEPTTKQSPGDGDEILRLLLKAGADVNAKGGTYMDALQAAATSRKAEAVKMLLAAGAEVTSRGGKCRSALEAAALGGHSDVIGLLLSTSARISAQIDILRDAREIADRAGYIGVVGLLERVIDRRGLGRTELGAAP